EDEDFSQHTVLFDIDAKDDLAPPGREPVDQTSDESPRRGIDSPTASATRRAGENDDFSQQRILFDATVESYRPEPLPDSGFGPRARRQENPQLDPGFRGLLGQTSLRWRGSGHPPVQSPRSPFPGDVAFTLATTSDQVATTWNRTWQGLRRKRRTNQEAYDP